MKRIFILLMTLVLLTAAVSAAQAATVTAQPADVTAAAGTLASFTVEADDAVAYRWQYKASGKTSWTALSSATTGYNEATVYIGAAQSRNGNLYRCAITSASGTVYYSDAATLTVTENPDPIRFAANPQDETVILGNRANFTVEVAGAGSENVKYQWQYQTVENGPWWNATAWTMGYNTATLNVIAAQLRDGFQYRCRVTDLAGIKYYSEPAVLTVGMPEKYAITEQPKIGYSLNGGKTQFHVQTQGEGLSYQWEYHRDITQTGPQYYWIAMGSTTGCKTDTLTVAGKSGSTNRDGWYYRCVITSDDGYIYTSEPAQLQVRTASITSQPQNAHLAANKTATFTVAVSGEVQSYQWYFSKNGGESYFKSTSTGSTTNSLQVTSTAARSGYLYRLNITDANGNLLISQPASLTLSSGASTTAYTVKFLNYNGDLLSKQIVESGKAAAAPEDPQREGRVFAGWDKAFDNVTSDLVINPVFEEIFTETYTVTFVDYDGSVLATQTVNAGADATLPADPAKTDATFLGWTGSYTDVTEDQTVRAVYSDEKNVIRCSSVSGAAGETVTVLLEITGTVKTCGFDLALFYDAGLELVSFDNDLDLDVVFNEEAYENGARLNFSGTTDRTKQRDIVELTFQISDGASGSLPVCIQMQSIKELDSNDNYVNTEYVLIHGAVTVE